MQEEPTQKLKFLADWELKWMILKNSFVTSIKKTYRNDKDLIKWGQHHDWKRDALLKSKIYVSAKFMQKEILAQHLEIQHL